MIGTRRISKRRKVLLAGTTLVLVFIFVQSILPQSVSADESGWVTEKILGPIFRQFGSQPPSQHAVRKAAHVLEFAVLSALLLLCFRGNVLNCVGAGFSSAFLDESLQMLSGRGAEIGDVWIDLIGIVAGTLLGLLIRKAALALRDRKAKNTD
ncbi:MAG: VanZ family protein [Clostridia bacterium]|nr:VanZ family protein [Clostridia bacterium]